MTATLTQRYITGTTKNLGAASEGDVRAELEASNADALDARIEQGVQRADAERAVLTELGDPALLAAGYGDRPLHLIGPRHYLTWARLLRILLTTLPLITFIGAALVESFSNDSIGEIIATGIPAGLSVGVPVAFWVTLVFAVLERIGITTAAHWNVDHLRSSEVVT
ncbi:permease prefix domain 1-containing protein [Cryobacterium sp. Y62]|uniref:permease prefix domain 1-containing protein n=1 Tax=Cryobacterium sp. Y62 TaxID=2048284 RepID=UPI000CE431D4|nr:permease prefix domain 1-containing protein [Cryobacterium sp. Y62]